jgi:hypothetical protein
MVHFLTSGLFQAIGYACMGPKVLFADGQRRRRPAALKALMQRRLRPRPAKVEPEADHGDPTPCLGTPRTCWALRMRARGFESAERWRTLVCMPEKDRERGTLALTSAATSADCACTPRVQRETRCQPMDRLATARRVLESPFGNSRDLRDAGIGARQRMLRRATSGWGLVRCLKESAMGIILPVAVK